MHLFNSEQIMLRSKAPRLGGAGGAGVPAVSPCAAALSLFAAWCHVWQRPPLSLTQGCRSRAGAQPFPLGLWDTEHLCSTAHNHFLSAVLLAVAAWVAVTGDGMRAWRAVPCSEHGPGREAGVGSLMSHIVVLAIPPHLGLSALLHRISSRIW